MIRQEFARTGLARWLRRGAFHLKAEVANARARAQRVVNTDLLQLYWTIGNAILTQQRAEGWGAKVIERLAKDLQAEFPDMKGLSRANLHGMSFNPWNGPRRSSGERTLEAALVCYHLVFAAPGAWRTLSPIRIAEAVSRGFYSRAP